MAATETKNEVGHVEETAPEINVHKAIEFDDPHKAAFGDNPDKPQEISWSTMLAILSLALSTVGSITLPILVVPAITLNIGTALGDTTTIGWIPASWAITSSVSCCIAGRVSDIFGRRYVMMLGQAFAIVGAAIAAGGQSVLAVIAGSSLLGVSCGLILVVYTAIPELVPFKYRALGLSVNEVTLYLPWGALAVLLGNLLVTHASWRWCYIIAAIYSIIALVGTGVFYFPPARPRHDFEKTRWEEFAELDFVGLGLYTCGLTIFLIGLSWAGTAGHSWKSASVIAPIVLGTFLLCCCFAYDWIIVSQDKAFFPLHLFKRFREFTVFLVVVFVAGMIYYSMSSLVPQATFYMFSNDGFQIGIISLPNGIGQLFGAVVMPAIMHRTRNPKMHVIAAVFIQTLFTALFAYAVPNHKAAWMAFQFFGQGCFVWITIATILNISLHVKHSDLGLAIGLIGTFRAAGGSLGDAVFGTILTGTVKGQIGPRIAKAAIAQGYKAADLAELIPAVIENAVGIPDAFANAPGVSPAVEAATSQAFRDAYAYAFKKVFLSTIPFGVIALVAALCISDASKYMTNHTAVVLERNLFRKRPKDVHHEVGIPAELADK